MPICFAHKRILQLRREIFFVRHEGVHARFWTRSFLHGSLYSERFRITCKDCASIDCHIPEHRPFACCVPKRFLLLLRSDLVSYATKAYMHGCGRGLLHGSLFSESYRSTCKDRASIAWQISEHRPFACCMPKRFLLLLRSDLVSYATKAYMHGFGRGLFCMDHFSLNLLEAHVKTARR